MDLSGWSFELDPKADFKEMFADAWRLERDYFYDRNMHGLDWKAMRAKYEPLVERVTDRDELNDLLAQMVGELSRAAHLRVRRRHPRGGRPGAAGRRWGRGWSATRRPAATR